MPYITELEKAGIATVTVEFADQKQLADSRALQNGVPNLRRVVSPRVGSGAERVQTFYDAMIKALTAPLTAKEQEKGVYTPPPNQRVLYEGTLDDAQEFFQATSPIAACSNCPIAKYTDGLPIVVPTEEKVAAMLMGTSHKANETIYAYSMNATTKQVQKRTTPVSGSLSKFNFTVEQVAINAVMAGCKPQYLPIVLAMSNTGLGVGTTSSWGQWQVVSGPIAKEIGMNAEMGLLGYGNPANAVIGRSYALMAVNLGGAYVGVTWESTFSNPKNLGGMCFAEDYEKNPAGWLTLSEESGYKKTESVLMHVSSCDGFGESDFAPSSYRSLQDAGEGGMATRLHVEGKKGPHNWLEYFVPYMYGGDFDPMVFLMMPTLAADLKAYGFASKQAVYEWWIKATSITIGQYKTYGWWDNRTAGGENIEPVSKKKYKDLPNDYVVPVAGNASEQCIIVCGGVSERVLWIPSGRGSIYPIDPWR